jgi:hypothetical protein
LETVRDHLLNERECLRFETHQIEHHLSTKPVEGTVSKHRRIRWICPTRDIRVDSDHIGILLLGWQAAIRKRQKYAIRRLPLAITIQLQEDPV